MSSILQKFGFSANVLLEGKRDREARTPSRGVPGRCRPRPAADRGSSGLPASARGGHRRAPGRRGLGSPRTPVWDPGPGGGAPRPPTGLAGHPWGQAQAPSQARTSRLPLGEPSWVAV